MKTAVIIRGQISRQDSIINAQLYKIGSKCKIKIVNVMLTPIYPDDAKAYSKIPRYFKVSTDLVTRPTFSETGEQLIQPTPILVYLHTVKRDEKLMVFNQKAEDFFTINNPSTYSQFYINEMEPIQLVDPDWKNNYWFDVSMQMVIDIPDSAE